MVCFWNHQIFPIFCNFFVLLHQLHCQLVHYRWKTFHAYTALGAKMFWGCLIFGWKPGLLSKIRPILDTQEILTDFHRIEAKKIIFFFQNGRLKNLRFLRFSKKFWKSQVYFESAISKFFFLLHPHENQSKLLGYQEWVDILMITLVYSKRVSVCNNLLHSIVLLS